MEDKKTRSIYRFKLSSNIIELIENFSRLHMYSSREVYNEKWKEWLLTNKKEIDIEKLKLQKLGYTKNVENKMYIAARYYFKKKGESSNNNIQEEKKNTKRKIKSNKYDKKTRKYVVLEEKIIKTMDSFIKEFIKEFMEGNNNIDIKPSNSYIIFTKIHKDIIDKEIERLKNIEVDSLNTQEKCLNKIKKAYKNRYNISVQFR